MNIKQAKNQLQNAMTAYFTKDKFGNYVIPIEQPTSLTCLEGRVQRHTQWCGAAIMVPRKETSTMKKDVKMVR